MNYIYTLGDRFSVCIVAISAVVIAQHYNQHYYQQQHQNGKFILDGTEIRLMWNWIYSCMRLCWDSAEIEIRLKLDWK